MGLALLAAGAVLGGLLWWLSASRLAPRASEPLALDAVPSSEREAAGGAVFAAPSRARSDGPQREAVVAEEGVQVSEPTALLPLVAGTVRDRRGRALSGAEIEVRMVDNSFELIAVGSDEEDDTPRPWTAVSDDQGRFAIRGAGPKRQVNVRASKHGFLVGEVYVAVGTTGLELTLSPAALSGRARLADGVSGKQVSVDLRRAGAPPGEAPIATRPLDSSGRFYLKQLDPGRYELSFKHQLREDYLYTMGPFAYPFEDPDLDARLQLIDLRHLIRRLTFEVLGPSSVPVPSGKLYWGESDPDRAPSHTRQISAGLARLDTPWPLIDVWVDAPHLRRVALEAISTGCRIDLMSPAECLVELDRDCPLMDAELVLYVKQPPAKAVRLTFRGSRSGHVDRRAHAPELSAAGRWNLEWWVIGARTVASDGTIRYGFSEKLPESEEPVLGRDYLEVEEGLVRQRFVVTPDAGVLETVLARKR